MIAPNPYSTSYEWIKSAISCADVAVEYGVELQLCGRDLLGRCPHPDHLDEHPSFAIAPDKDLWFCRSACGTGGDVISLVAHVENVSNGEAAIRLAERLGMATIPTTQVRPSHSKKKPVTQKAERKELSVEVEWIRRIGRPTKWAIKSVNGTHVAMHGRQDWECKVTHESEEPRLEKRKKMWWSRPGDKSGLGGMPYQDLPLYRSEFVKEYPCGLTIYITEGESDCDALTAAGYYAVATVTGAGGCPSVEALEVLRGRDVVIWADYDTPGLRHAVAVGEALAGIAERVRIHSCTPPCKPGAGAADDLRIIAEIERRQADDDRKGE